MIVLDRTKKILLGVGAALVAGAGVLLVTKKSAAEEARARGFASAVLERAQSDVGIVETSPNDSARIRRMLENVGVTIPANWCAAAVATWIHEAAASLGVPPPIAGSASVLATVQQFQDAKNDRVSWIDVAALRANPALVLPGMVVAWSRGGASSGLGHIGIVERGGSSFATIEGNAGANADRVVRSVHDLTSDSLLGMGRFDDRAIFGDVAGVGYRNNPPGAALFPVT